MKKNVSIFIMVCFIITGQIGTCPVYAQDFVLPKPGVMVPLSPEFNPPILKGIKVHPDNPFRFEFILDKGDSSVIPAKAGIQNQEQLKIEATKLIKYFLASLTIPEKDLWVNLSPYEKDRIIPQSFGLTEMGRDLLAEDYMLKQITASLIYPEGEVGKRFWKRIYEEAAKKFGTTNIPVNTFNKVWIVPEKAVVYENAKAGTAYVVESRLKVMLEEDYLSMQKHSVTNPFGSQVVREIVIPELTKEVNEGKNFVQLRQVYNSLILTTWYKKKIKDSILAQVYANKNKVAGIVSLRGSETIEAIYQQYLQAFKKGAYNYIKEEIDPATQQPIPRKYFSGGLRLIVPLQETTDRAMVTNTITGSKRGKLSLIGVLLSTVGLGVPLGKKSINTGFKFSYRGRIEKEKTKLRESAFRLMEELPVDSQWRKYWMKAAEIPVEEVVREPKEKIKGIIHTPYQLAYYLNQYSLREAVLTMMLESIVSNFDIDKYHDFLNSAHRIELIGRDQNTIYYGWDYMYGVRSRRNKAEKRSIVRQVLEGKRDLKEFYKRYNLPASFNAFMRYIHLSPDASKDEIIDAIVSYYYETMTDLPFGPAGVNHSFVMNIVNAMLRLKGLNGISHSEFDYHMRSFHVIKRMFSHSIQATNQREDAAMAGDKDILRGVKIGDRVTFQVKTARYKGDHGGRLKIREGTLISMNNWEVVIDTKFGPKVHRISYSRNSYLNSPQIYGVVDILPELDSLVVKDKIVVFGNGERFEKDAIIPFLDTLISAINDQLVFNQSNILEIAVHGNFRRILRTLEYAANHRKQKSFDFVVTPGISGFIVKARADNHIAIYSVLFWVKQLRSLIQDKAMIGRPNTDKAQSAHMKLKDAAMIGRPNEGIKKFLRDAYSKGLLNREYISQDRWDHLDFFNRTEEAQAIKTEFFEKISSDQNSQFVNLLALLHQRIGDPPNPIINREGTIRQLEELESEGKISSPIADWLKKVVQAVWNPYGMWNEKIRFRGLRREQFLQRAQDQGGLFIIAYSQGIANYVKAIAAGKDAAMAEKGGIDFNSNKMNLQVKTGSPTKTFGDDNGGIKFHLDPALLQQLQNAPGFVPVIINIQPLKSLSDFLCIKNS